MINTGLLCLASEKGKIIVNECLDRKYHINTLKLEKLLILAHGIMLAKYQTPLFKEDIVATLHGGLMIPRVDRDFIRYAVEFKDKFVEYICLLDDEEKVLNHVLDSYGNLDAVDINEESPLKVCNKSFISLGDSYSSSIATNAVIENIFSRYYFQENNNIETFQKRMINRYPNKK